MSGMELQTAYESLSKDNIFLFIELLEGSIKKNFSLSHLRRFGFKTSWKENELNERNQCDIQLAIRLLKHLRNQDSFDQPLAKLTIADVFPILNQSKAIDHTKWRLYSTNTLPAFLHFNQAKNLFWQHELSTDKKNPYNTNLLSVYALRLALEARIKKMLGITYAQRKNKAGWQDIGLDELIRIAGRLKSIKYSQNINWNEIRQVNKWFNAFVHSTIRPFPWLIFQAIEVLEPLYDSKPVEAEKVAKYSLYSSTQTVSIEDVRKELHTLLSKKQEIQIYWNDFHELMINDL
jgi:hypothetical protein